jgi:hypothetical protein
MNRLTYFLKLMGNSKIHSGAKCNVCGSTPMFQGDFHLLASEFMDICNSKYCVSNEGITRKARYLKMVDLFHPFQNHGSSKFVSFQVTSEREFNICMKWLSEIGHRCENHEGKFIISTDITRPQWYEYLYQVQD